MRGVTITDSSKDGRFLAVDLADILRLLGSRAEDAEWELSEVECVGVAADTVYQLAESKARVPGRTLLRLASDVTQVIEGVFAGYLTSQAQPWIIIRAVDSSAYDVQTEDQDILRRIKQQYKRVRDLPNNDESGD